MQLGDNGKLLEQGTEVEVVAPPPTKRAARHVSCVVGGLELVAAPCSCITHGFRCQMYGRQGSAMNSPRVRLALVTKVGVFLQRQLAAPGAP